MCTGYFHIKGYLMSHHLAGTTNQVANIIVTLMRMAIRVSTKNVGTLAKIFLKCQCRRIHKEWLVF